MATGELWEASASADYAKIAVDRLTFFSDAVVAIAMTLLAIDLAVPETSTRPDFVAFVQGHLGSYLAFLISFVVIASVWRNHHRVFRYITDAPPALVGVTLLWLFTIVLVPFATRLLYAGDSTSASSDFPFRFGIYALVMVASSSAFVCSEVIVQRAGIVAEEAPTDLFDSGMTRSAVLITTFLLSIPLCFLVGVYAFILWGALPITTRVGIAIQHRRRR
ncbi:TMEM175 family protein [Lapillicoccus sp.]|uniref:TMEM175 family protein n=1 Tax=Lapillicoccus sp. TaxID=1909287 RepID=UPI003267FA07